MMKKFLLSASTLGAVLALSTACAPPVDTSCETSVDCEGNSICHPTLKECVDNCLDESVTCGDATPDCVEPGAGDTIVGDNADFNNVCVCNADSCAEGEVCSDTTGQCEAAGDVKCTDTLDVGADNPDDDTQYCAEDGTFADKCTKTLDVGDENPDDATQYCADTGMFVEKCTETMNVGDEHADDATKVCVADGTFADKCVDTDCVANGALCQDDIEADNFNECAAPDEVTAFCAAADEFDGGRDAEGPVIWEVVYDPEPELDSECDAGKSAYAMDFYYHDLEGDAYAAHSVPAYSNFKWSEEGQSPLVSTLPLSFDDDSTASTGVAYMYVCFTSAPDAVAVQIADEAGNLSNVACDVE